MKLSDELKALRLLADNTEAAARQKDIFYKHYWELRSRNEQSFLGGLSLKTRSHLHPLFLILYRIINRANGIRIRILQDRRTHTDRPLIFAPTHVGKYDVEASGEALKDHFYLLSGDFENLQGGIEQVFLNLNGVFFFQEQDPSDRKAVTEKMISHLREGGNLLYFPEGAWNLSPHLPVLPLYWGIIDIARSSHALIVPVGEEQYRHEFIVNIGSCFDVNAYEDSMSGKRQAIQDLRDRMASLKWEIWEQMPCCRRKDLTPEIWENYIDQRLSEWPGFDREHIDSLIYRPKGVSSPEEAFAFKEKLIPSMANAFLFGKQPVS